MLFMTHSKTMFKNLSELEKAVVQCKKCDRLVTFREKVAKEKRKSYMHWDYWGKAVPGYGNPNAKICLLYTSPSPRDATLSRMPSSA